MGKELALYAVVRDGHIVFDRNLQNAYTSRKRAETKLSHLSENCGYKIVKFVPEEL